MGVAPGVDQVAGCPVRKPTGRPWAGPTRSWSPVKGATATKRPRCSKMHGTMLHAGDVLDVLDALGSAVPVELPGDRSSAGHAARQMP